MAAEHSVPAREVAEPFCFRQHHAFADCNVRSYNGQCCSGYLTKLTSFDAELCDGFHLLGRAREVIRAGKSIGIALVPHLRILSDA